MNAGTVLIAEDVVFPRKPDYVRMLTFRETAPAPGGV